MKVIDRVAKNHVLHQRGANNRFSRRLESLGRGCQMGICPARSEFCRGYESKEWLLHRYTITSDQRTRSTLYPSALATDTATVSRGNSLLCRFQPAHRPPATVGSAPLRFFRDKELGRQHRRRAALSAQRHPRLVVEPFSSAWIRKVPQARALRDRPGRGRLAG